MTNFGPFGAQPLGSFGDMMNKAAQHARDAADYQYQQRRKKKKQAQKQALQKPYVDVRQKQALQNIEAELGRTCARLAYIEVSNRYIDTRILRIELGLTYIGGCPQI